MDKRIGSIVFLWMFVGLLQAEAPKVFLDVTDSTGHHVVKTGVGVPFTVDVNVTGDSRLLPKPHLKGLEQFDRGGTRTSTQVNSINGKTTVKETYTTVVQALKEGNFVIGPASIEYDGKIVQSDSVTIAVSADYEPDREEIRGAFLTLHVEKNQVFLGEPFDISLRFYQDSNDIKLEGISKPSFDSFSGKDLRGPETGTSTIDGKKYRYLEWTTTLYPQKEGMLVIPSIRAVYSVLLKDVSRRGDIFSMMNSFLGGMREDREVHSNVLKIDVKPLPSHEPPVKAVGNFSDFKAKVNNKTAGEGEGIVLTLELSGSGNFDQLTHPLLEIPDQLTYYDSNARLVSISKEKPQAKLFEYIIQGLSSGEFTIPSQTFTFFDLKTEEYRTLKTEPLTINVKAVNVNKSVSRDDQTVNPDLIVKASHIEVDGPWKKAKTRAISWGWFFLIVMFPIFVSLIGYFIRKREEYILNNAPQIRYAQAFKNAKITFHKARASHYRGQLYHMFIELFAARLKVSRTEISEGLIEETLRAKNLSEEKIREWRLLFAHLAECAFSSHRQQEKDDYLFNKSLHWLNELEKVL